MTTAVIIPEQLRAKATELAIPDSLSADLLVAYAPHAQAGGAIKEKIATADAVTPAFAREMRLAMVKVRTGADKTRKALKADSLLRGKAIDGLAAMIEMEATSVERQMEDIEKAAERAEAARIAKLREDRLAKLRPYVTDPTAYQVEKMTDVAFLELLDASRLAHEARERARIDAERQEAERAEAARQAAAEAERLRQEELAKLRAEAEANRKRAEEEAAARAQAEAAARREREEAERKAAEERRVAEQAAAAERARVEAERAKERARLAQIEAERRAEAEAKARADAERVAAEERAAAAPDAEKIRAVADQVRAIAIPEMGQKREAQHTQIVAQRDKFAAWLDGMAAKLEA